MANKSNSFPIAGVGASAGGVEALGEFFKGIPPNPGIAFVIITHLSPERESQLPQIIQRYTSLEVVTSADGMEVEADHVYVLPFDAIQTIKDGCLHIKKQAPNKRERKPVDVFLGSLATDRGELAVSVVLSGGDGDGALGTKAVKERGGLTMAQAPDGHGPGHPDMPKSAIATGYVDFAIPAAEMGAKLAQFANGIDVLDALVTDEGGDPKTVIEAARNEICDIIRHQIGHDFNGYKTKTFFRRVHRRMQVRQAEALEAYIEMLRQEPQEIGALFRDLLINVTNFFRDADAFEKLAEIVIPKLFENRGADDAVRVWVPGCASGEEVFSIAILLREHMDKLRAVPRVQVFATDIDDEALGVARAGRYPEALLDSVSAERKKRFFIADGGSYVVSKDVRDLCIFSPHSLIRDPPFSRIDLVSCRNLLIYFGTMLQNQVMPTFHYSLRPGGFLFLGMSENVTQFDGLFDPIEKKHRIFRSREDAMRRIRLPLNIPSSQTAHGAVKKAASLTGLGSLQHSFETQVLERHAPPHVVANAEGEIVYFSSRTGRYLETPAGVPTRNLTSLAKKGLRLDLGAVFRDALEKNAPASRRGLMPVEESEELLSVIMTVEPVWAQNRDDRLFLVLFEEEGSIAARALGDSGESQAHDVNLRLEHQVHELKDRLQSTIEEYETSVEELKSSNEELVSVNEELQSTNEELEASKEELQSMNEELHTVNNELGIKIEALDMANSDLRNLFDSTQVATVFLDHKLTIRSFTPAMTKIFHILPTDRGRPITDLASRIDTSALRQDIETVLASGSAMEREIRDPRTFVHYLIKTNAYRSLGGRIDGVVVTFVDVTRLAQAEAEQQMLISELHHRTRNLLAMVQSLAAQSIKNSHSMDEFQDKFNGRLASLSRVQGLLSTTNPEVITLDRLLKMELEAYEITTESGRVTIEGPKVVLPDELVRMMALALHELVTNAIKYGALHTANGRLAVKWDVKKHDGLDDLKLDWLETGVDIDLEKAAAGSSGFGRYLIEKGLPHQFGGHTVYEMAKVSVHCIINVPFGSNVE